MLVYYCYYYNNKNVGHDSQLGVVNWAFLESLNVIWNFINNLRIFASFHVDDAMIFPCQDCRSHKMTIQVPPPPIVMINDFIMFSKLEAYSPILFKDMSFPCLFLDPHLVTNHSNMGVHIRWKLNWPCSAYVFQSCKGFVEAKCLFFLRHIST